MNRSAGTNQWMQSVVIHPNECVEIFPKAEILNECDGYFAPSLHNPGGEIGLFNLRSRIEPHWKTYTTFRVIDLRRDEMSLGQFDGEATRLDLLQSDPKKKKDAHEINP